MNGLDAALVIGLLVVLTAGIGVGGILAARNPKFWMGLAAEVIKQVAPIVAKRMTPEQEKAFQDCMRRGGQWDHARKRCK